jgi:hypothetical protein
MIFVLTRFGGRDTEKIKNKWSSGRKLFCVFNSIAARFAICLEKTYNFCRKANVF